MSCFYCLRLHTFFYTFWTFRMARLPPLFFAPGSRGVGTRWPPEAVRFGEKPPANEAKGETGGVAPAAVTRRVVSHLDNVAVERGARQIDLDGMAPSLRSSRTKNASAFPKHPPYYSHAAGRPKHLRINAAGKAGTNRMGKKTTKLGGRKRSAAQNGLLFPPLFFYPYISWYSADRNQGVQCPSNRDGPFQSRQSWGQRVAEGTNKPARGKHRRRIQKSSVATGPKQKAAVDNETCDSTHGGTVVEPEYR